MAKGIQRRIEAAMKKVREEIAFNAQGGKYASGLASEGYAGGYLQALSDVHLLLRGIDPGNTRGYWTRPKVNEQSSGVKS